MSFEIDKPDLLTRLKCLLESNQNLLMKIQDKEISNRDIANLLGCNESYVSQLISKMGLTRIRCDRQHAKKITEECRNSDAILKNRLASQVLAGQLSAAQAAQRAGCSKRTIHRYVNRLASDAES